MATAWPTPAEVLEKIAAAAVTLSASFTTAYIQGILDAVAQTVAIKTRRQFVAGSAGEIRYFHGSGTPEMEVDEFITVTLVRVLWLDAGGTGLTLSSAVALEENGLPNTRIVLARGSPPLIYGTLVDHFPEGRGNIEITGTWGYAATIPQDLWEAVRAEAAARLVDESLFRATGRLQAWHDDDVSETYQLPGGSGADPRPAVWTGWHRGFTAALRDYRRPTGHRFRKLRPVLL